MTPRVAKIVLTLLSRVDRITFDETPVVAEARQILTDIANQPEEPLPEPLPEPKKTKDV